MMQNKTAQSITEDKQEGDPSMEEILETIRGVISGENEAVDTAAENTDDVLELTDIVESKQPAEVKETVVASEETSTIANQDVMDDIDNAISDNDKEMLPEVPSPDSVADRGSDPELLNQVTRTTSQAALSQLAKLTETVGSDSSMQFRSGTTIETLVIEAIKPELSAWLNVNLPGLVQSIVEREIAKLSPPK